MTFIQPGGFTFDETDALAVRVDDDEVPIESIVDYSIRLQRTLPNFPDDVISQWFYEPRQTIHQNSWLPYSKLRFHLEKFSLVQVSQPVFSENPIVAQYRTHFEYENTSHRMECLEAFIQQHGTWPRAPIVLANPDSLIVTPWGMRCDAPYHLLEGHHRFAVLLAKSNAKILIQHHNVWVAEWPKC